MPMIDVFDTESTPNAGMTAPFTRHYALTASNTVDQTLTRAVRCNAAGDAALVTEDGTAIVYTVTAGEIIPGRFKRLNVTGTTVATCSVVGWY